MSNTDRLSLHGMPIVRTLDDFAKLVHVSKGRIYQYSTNAEKYYKTYILPKKKGRGRLIASPCKGLKGVQSWILRNILDKLNSSEYSFGFEKGKNILNNASAHLGANAILVYDIKDFFHSVTSEYVYRLFRSIGYNKLVSTIFTNLCTFERHLPQGSPCSPKIANLYCISLDTRLNAFATKRGITYTRYADDLTFSASMPSKLQGISYTIEKIIKDEKLPVNKNKTKLVGPSKQREITGLILYEDKVGVGRKKYKVIRALLTNIVNNKYPPDIPKDIERLNGYISFIKNVDNVRYRQLKRHYENMLKKKPRFSKGDLIAF